MTTPRPLATLAGVLSGFALADVLQLLELGARTGDLAVDGGSLGRGTIRLRAGCVVSVTDNGRAVAGADAQRASLARMLDWSAGRWAFHTDDDRHGAERCEHEITITAILVDAARHRDEHARRAPRPLPTGSDVPELADDDHGDGDPVCERLTAGDLQVLAAVDGSRDVRALAAATRRDVAHVAATLDRLRAFGVVRPSSTAHRGAAA